MKCVSILIILALPASILPMMASNPGEPLDCSDWVFNEPGLSCRTEVTYPTNSAFNGGGSNGFFVNGDIMQLEYTNDPWACGTGDIATWRIWRSFPSGDTTLIASIQDRCNSSDPIDMDRGIVAGVSFDRINGRLLILFEASSVIPPPSLDNYPLTRTRIAVTGFATLFDELQSFTPTANELSFRVPYMPEGFQYADYFDTYYGDLATVGDWSQAQPLACGFPASAPSVGDYLTVADTLPALKPGEGRYYITAATYMGRRRYGRKSSGGVLTGRDPAVLPACE